MGLKAALLSGGKDSLYAAYLEKPIDIGIVLVYEFPRPSPHLVNLAATVKTLLLTGMPVVVHRLQRGREFDDTVMLLQKLNVDVVVAGDVYVEDHLHYMEKVANEAGARLREPLWGRDPRSLVYEIFEEGFEALVTGTDARISKWLGKLVKRDNVDNFVGDVLRAGADPLGEQGEYHTLVVYSPLHSARLSYKPLRVEEHGNYLILRVEA